MPAALCPIFMCTVTILCMLGLQFSSFCGCGLSCLVFVVFQSSVPEETDSTKEASHTTSTEEEDRQVKGS